MMKTFNKEKFHKKVACSRCSESVGHEYILYDINKEPICESCIAEMDEGNN